MGDQQKQRAKADKHHDFGGCNQLSLSKTQPKSNGSNPSRHQPAAGQKPPLKTCIQACAVHQMRAKGATISATTNNFLPVDSLESGASIAIGANKAR